MPDRPGALAQLLADVARHEVNLEDLRVDHAPGQPEGIATLALAPTARQRLVKMSEGSAKKEVTGGDIQILEVERDRLRRRLDFWELRIHKIERGSAAE